jgi:hypothetical protein
MVLGEAGSEMLVRRPSFFPVALHSQRHRSCQHQIDSGLILYTIVYVQPPSTPSRHSRVLVPIPACFPEDDEKHENGNSNKPKHRLTAR